MRIPFAENAIRASCLWCDRGLLVVAMSGALCLCAVVAVIVVDVLIRRSIEVSIAGTVDITQLFVMACAFLAIPLAFMRNAHVSVEFVTDRLPPRLLAALNALNMLLSAGLMIALLVYGYQQSLLQVANGDRSQTIGIPIVWYWAPLLLGMALSVLACILLAVRHALAAMGLGNLIASPVGVPAQEAS